MWIKKGTFIINTDNIAAIYLRGGKLFFRTPGQAVLQLLTEVLSVQKSV